MGKYKVNHFSFIDRDYFDVHLTGAKSERFIMFYIEHYCFQDNIVYESS